MGIIMVGRIMKGRSTTGFRFLERETGRVQDLTYSCVYKLFSNGKGSVFENLKFNNGEITGVNGAVNRYGVVGGKPVIVVIGAIEDGKGEIQGYEISDTEGNVKKIRNKDALYLAKKFGVANGKVSSSTNGKEFISCIEGKYPRVCMEEMKASAPKDEKRPIKVEERPIKVEERPIKVEERPIKAEARTVEKKEEQIVSKDGRIETAEDRERRIQVSDMMKNIYGMDKVTAIKITEEKKHPLYKESFLAKVMYTVEKYKKISEKQKNVVDSTYSQWFDGKDGRGKSEVKPIEVDIPENVSFSGESKNYKLKFKRMDNGSIYCGGLENEFRWYDGDIVVPDMYEGVPVTGIVVEAFRDSKINGITIGPNIKDIGIGAFYECRKMTFADLSRGKHEHIAVNCFFMCRSLKSVRMGDLVVRVHDKAFYGCSTMEIIKFPARLETLSRESFATCRKLMKVEVNNNLESINESAFKGCSSLAKIDLKNVKYIGAYSFSESGLVKICIPSTVDTIGRYAFSKCKELSDIEINEGCKEISEYAFWKSLEEKGSKKISVVTIPKSVVLIGNGAFGDVDVMRVYYGTSGESYGIAFNKNLFYVDEINAENSIRARKRASAISMSLMKKINDELKEEEDETVRVVKLEEEKLIDVEYNEAMSKALGISLMSEEVVPSDNFIGAVNCLTRCSKLFTKPLNKPVVRFMDTFYVEAQRRYDDGCNKIYRMVYTTRDTLDKGIFLIVIMRNRLRYICEYNARTDITLEDTENLKETLPLRYLHAGDTVGTDGAIAGENGRLKVDGIVVANVTKTLWDRMMKHMITIGLKGTEQLMLSPSKDIAIRVFDGRIYERAHRVKRGTPDCLNVVDVMDLEGAYNIINGLSVGSNQNKKYFEELANASDHYVEARIKSLGKISEETISDIFMIAKRFKSTIGDKVRYEVKPSDLEPNLFREIANSYWMITKDIDWFKGIGRKSLNKLDEHHIGGYIVEEYISNQVVKFSNPYMQGCKGAYVFVMKYSGQIMGVYTSRMSLKQISEMLYDMTEDRTDEGKKELMKNPRVLDECNPAQFYNFYNVLYNSSGWQMNKFSSSYISNFVGASFHISVYKPTGVMYLTMERLAIKNDGEKSGGREVNVRRTYPIFMIGDVDRALMVANTTNTGARESKFLEEMMRFSAYIYMEENNMLTGVEKKEKQVYYNYMKVREMTCARVTEVEKYRGLADDRILYMIGVSASGKPSVYNSMMSRGNFEDYEEAFEDDEEDWGEEDEIQLSVEEDEEEDDMFGDDEEENEDETDDVDWGEEDELEEEPDYDSMSAEELAELLAQAGIDVNSLK